MGYHLQSRYRILLAIIACYAAPLTVLIFFTVLQSPISSIWLPASAGLLLTAMGGLLLFLLLSSWESALAVVVEPKAAPEPPPPVPTLDPQLLVEAEARYCSTLEDLTAATIKSDNLEVLLAQSNNEILNVTKEKEKIQRQVEQTRQEYEQFKVSTEEKLEQNHLFLGEYQQTINEQRQAVETKQQLIEQLETKVRDLTYEIKTLLRLAEKVQCDKPQTVVPISLGAHALSEVPATYHTGESSERPPAKRAEPSLSMGKAGQLRRCLDIAQKITGGSHYANRQPRTREIPFDNNALDLRRLCESLRSEATSALWVYSQKENKLLFANQEIKTLLGWHPEKFMQNFSDIIDTEAWQRIQSQLTYKNDCEASLSLQTKSGQSVILQCQMGVIPTGLFRGHIICIAQ